MTQKSQFILITGATGQAGGSGSHVARQLIAQGQKVRALVHKEDDRSRAVQALGAEVVVGDLLNLKDVRSAMRGVRSAYLVFPLSPSIVGASAVFAQAAKENELELVVNMSQLPARSDAKSPASLNHWLAEQVLDRSSVPTVHIRATFFMEWLLWVTPFIKATGNIVMPWDVNSQYTPVAAEDLGRAIAQILLSPQKHVGRIYDLVGPQQLSFKDLAAKLSGAVGKEIPYQQLEARAFAEKMGMPSYFSEHVEATTKSLSEGFFKVNNSLIATITGNAPMTVDDFIRKHQSRWVS